MSKEELEASLRTFEWLFQVCTVLLALATVGATGFGVKAWLLSNRIKKVEHANELRTQEEIARLNKDTADTKERTSKADERVRQLEHENLALGVRLEEEKQRRLEIERRLAPRFITPTEHTTIVAALRSYAGHGVTVTKLGDAEAAAFADQLIATFSNSGWSVQRNTIGVLSPSRYGLICRVPAHRDSAVATIMSTLEALHIQFETETVESRPDFIEILVGLKPPT